MVIGSLPLGLPLQMPGLRQVGASSSRFTGNTIAVPIKACGVAGFPS
jgi:hypothetical protein